MSHSQVVNQRKLCFVCFVLGWGGVAGTLHLPPGSIVLKAKKATNSSDVITDVIHMPAI